MMKAPCITPGTLSFTNSQHSLQHSDDEKAATLKAG